MAPKSCKKRKKREDALPRKRTKRKGRCNIKSSPDEFLDSDKDEHKFDDNSSIEDSSSDSNAEMCIQDNSGYLHDKIGIYVKDDTGSTIDKSQLVKLLPADFSVIIVEYSDKERCDKVPGFSCSLRLSIKDKETILTWLKLFEQKTYTVYRVDSTFKCEKSKKLVFKKNFRCQNNQYNHPNRNKENKRKKRVEHTACPAKISLTIKNQDMQRTTDTYLKDYPAVINIRFTHNHKFRTDRDLRLMKPQKMIFEDIKYVEEIKAGNIISNVQITSLNNKDIEIQKDVTELENKDLSNEAAEDKNTVMNNDWNDIICDDVFERSNASLCLQKETEVLNCTNILFEIDRFCSVLKQKVSEEPDLYSLPVTNFIESFNCMKTDSELTSALSSFGYCNETVAPYKKENFVNMHNVNIQSVQTIGEMPTKVFTNAYKVEKDDRIFVPSEHPYYRITTFAHSVSPGTFQS